jgi:hypothetical protein
MVNIFRRAYDF